jgi:MATE family multidrug resistance protein
MINQGETTAPAGVPTEGTPLLQASRGDPSDNQEVDEEEIDKTWEEAIMAGLIQTTWRREAQVIGKYTAPLMVTFLLQYSLTVASIFTLGHMGKEQLSAVTLASMTANITGYAVYQGLATSLDTLCAQAYGSGKKKLVGLQLQRMVWFLMVITIPIALVWFFSDKILVRLIPESEVAKLAGLYLKIVLLGAPGYACFEGGKRYVQAQGLFSAATYVLLICAPLNALMNWLFVWVSR